VATKLKDVAREAGVSPTTVSLVLNQRTSGVRISEATRQRVRGVAQELNYSPNCVARALRTAKTYTVGVVSFDVSDPMATACALQLDRELAGHGYRTTVGDARHDAIQAIDHVQDFLTSRADGIVLLASSYRPDANILVQMQRQRGVPIICMFRDLSEGGIQSFVVNYRRGARDITKHLLEIGYQRVWNNQSSR